jgi:hypothetical protein
MPSPAAKCNSFAFGSALARRDDARIETLCAVVAKVEAGPDGAPAPDTG